MNGILDQIARERKRFVPDSLPELFALMLATRLRDASNARVYAALVDRYGMQNVLAAYWKLGSPSDGAQTVARALAVHLTPQEGMK